MSGIRLVGRILDEEDGSKCMIAFILIFAMIAVVSCDHTCTSLWYVSAGVL